MRPRVLRCRMKKLVRKYRILQRIEYVHAAHLVEMSKTLLGGTKSLGVRAHECLLVVTGLSTTKFAVRCS